MIAGIPAKLQSAAAAVVDDPAGVKDPPAMFIRAGDSRSHGYHDQESNDQGTQYHRDVLHRFLSLVLIFAGCRPSRQPRRSQRRSSNWLERSAARSTRPGSADACGRRASPRPASASPPFHHSPKRTPATTRCASFSSASTSSTSVCTSTIGEAAPSLSCFSRREARPHVLPIPRETAALAGECPHSLLWPRDGRESVRQ